MLNHGIASDSKRIVTVVVGVEPACRVAAEEDLVFASRAAEREVVPVRAKRLIPVLEGRNNATNAAGVF